MRKRVDAVDFLRSISIIAIILLHIIYPLDFQPSSSYASNNIIIFLRDILNFCVVTLVIVSGFSLSNSTRKIKFNIKNTLQYFKKRAKRIIVPWLIYIAVSALIYGIIAFLLPDFSTRIFQKFPYFSYQSIWKIPFRWIILKWIIILMIMLGFLFPFLKYIYKKGRTTITLLFLFYIFSIILSIKYSLNPYDYLNISFVNIIKPSLSVLSFIATFVLGWSLVFIFGFYLEKLYFEDSFRKKIIALTIIAIISFIIINAIYNFIGLDTSITLNKTPPNPYYLIFGISITLILLTIFYQLPDFMSKCKAFFIFFSNNSLWIFLWSYLTIVFVSIGFSHIDINIYLKIALEFISNLILLAGIIILQNNLKRIRLF
ncbi:acyltransferase family protein [Candidatus Pacearchaeota archaeon]|nr:acyltransferase family protein [Candidatus Pacearchaeota archaeon]